MDDKRVSAALLAALMFGGAVGEAYSPAEAKSCPARPCAALQGLQPPWAPDDSESESVNSARPYTTLVVTATGPTGSASVGTGAAFGGSGGFFVGDEGIRVINGSLGPTGPKQPFTTGAPNGFVPTGPAGP